MLDQKCAKNIKRSIENNLNENAEAISLGLFCKKHVPKKIHNITGKHLCQSLPFDKVAFLKPAIY